MRQKWFEYENLNTGPYIRVGRMYVFIFRKYYRGSWGLDADGLFAICTPWFEFHPW